MLYVIIGLLCLLLATVLLSGFLLWRRISDLDRDMLSKLHGIQIQLAFVCGRIGLKKQDLDRAVLEQPEEPEVATEVVGDINEWVDLDEAAQYAEPNAPGQSHS